MKSDRGVKVECGYYMRPARYETRSTQYHGHDEQTNTFARSTIVDYGPKTT